MQQAAHEAAHSPDSNCRTRLLPMPMSTLSSPSRQVRTGAVDENGWPVGFFDRIAGSMPELHRGSQGECLAAGGPDHRRGFVDRLGPAVRRWLPLHTDRRKGQSHLSRGNDFKSEVERVARKRPQATIERGEDAFAAVR
jgi:hypothetical protein